MVAGLANATATATLAPERMLETKERGDGVAKDSLAKTAFPETGVLTSLHVSECVSEVMSQSMPRNVSKYGVWAAFVAFCVWRAGVLQDGIEAVDFFLKAL